MNTEITYLYRDAANWKVYESVIVEGVVSFDDLSAHFCDGDYFIPDVLGWKNLAPNPRTEYDHIYHEIFSCEPTNLPANSMTAVELVERFKSLSDQGWIRAWM